MEYEEMLTLTNVQIERAHELADTMRDLRDNTRERDDIAPDILDLLVTATDYVVINLENLKRALAK